MTSVTIRLDFEGRKPSEITEADIIDYIEELISDGYLDYEVEIDAVMEDLGGFNNCLIEGGK